MKKFRLKWRVLAIAALALFTANNASALSTKYYKTDLTATAGGKVYASLDYVQPNDTSFATTSTTGSVEDSISYIFARPASGYAFSYWEKTSGSIDSSSFDKNSNPLMVVNAGTSTEKSSPATVEFKAHFVPAAVSVSSEDNVLGSASISQDSNVVGNTITLRAIPSDDVFKRSKFDGWYFNGKLVSTLTPYTFTIADENKGEYVAHFTRQGGYFRIKSYPQNRYAYMVGDSASVAEKSVDKWAGVKFDQSILLSQTLDPTDLNYVIGIDGISDLYTKGMKDIDVTCQGISARNIISNVKYNGVSYGSATIDTKPSGNYWTFSFNFGGERYLKDGALYGYDYAIACGGATDHLWTLEPVDSIPVNFNIQANSSKYTTLYTTFPYKLGDNIIALKVDEDLNFVSLSNQSIPANTAVILRLTDVSSSQGYIHPLFDDTIESVSGNILKGYSIISDSVKNGDNILVVGSENNKLALVNYNGTILPVNRAYIDTDNLSDNSLAKLFNSNTTGISEFKRQSVKSDVIYDLSGRKMSNANNLKRGIYIKNGKKIIIR